MKSLIHTQMSKKPDISEGDDERTVVNLDPILRTLGGFTQVPNAVLCHPAISLGGKVVYGVLLSFSWQKDFCKPAQDAISQRCGVGIRMVQRYLNELRKHGAIDWKQIGLNRPNRYYINPIDTWIKVLPEADASYLSHPDPTDTALQGTSDTAHKEDSAKKIQSNVNVQSTRTLKAAQALRPSSSGGSSPDLHTYSAEELEARIFQLREGLGDRGPSDFNMRQIVKKLPVQQVDEAYFQAVGKARDDRTSNAASYFVGICKIKAKDLGIGLGFTGKGVGDTRGNTPQQHEIRNVGPESIKEVRGRGVRHGRNTGRPGASER